jgi:hypothetical protein
VRLAQEQGLSLTGPDGLLKQLTKTVLETALNEEMAEHLGYEKHDPAGVGTGNIRNGTRAKTDKPENALELHQLRDLLVRVEDPIGGGVGLGNAETFALGAFPERGLTAENSFL